MELMDLYSQVQNPIEDPRVIEKLIKAYSKLETSGDFYSQLIRMVEKDDNKGEYYTMDSDYFYSMMFNKWKNNIIKLTPEQLTELCEICDQGIIKLRKILKTVSDVKTKKEADDILYRNYGDIEIKFALQMRRWNAGGGKSTYWEYVHSKYVRFKPEKQQEIEHRLYLNVESSDIYKMIIYLIEKLDKYNLPYCFKFTQFADRDDNIVIYSTTENLIKYVEILQEIKNEHPNLVSRVKEPPILTGKIDGWIGYGSEPTIRENSFNEMRAEIIEHAIDKALNKWIMEHRNAQIIYQRQKLSFQDYIALKSTERMIENLESDFVFKELWDKGNIRKKYKKSEAISKFGYTLREIRTPGFKNNVYKYISSQIGTCLLDICNGTYKKMDDIKIDVRNGKQICFSQSDLEKIIRELSVNISKSDPNFMNDIYESIVTEARQYGVDTEKFCFDIKTRERMKLAANKTQQEQPIIQEKKVEQSTNVLQHSQQIETLKQVDKELIDLINQAVLAYESYLASVMEVNNITQGRTR